MLQICSGKLFQREVQYKNDLRGIIYTNLRLLRDRKIDTSAGSLLSTSSLGKSNAIIYEIEELIEANGQGPGTLVSHGIAPYILDFSTLLSFILNCTASPSHTLTDRLLGEQRGLSTHSTPKQVVKQVFDEEIYFKESDEERLVEFIKQLIGLERSTYLGVMRAIRTYVTGMHRIADDFELAYTLLVASIESLAQDFDGYRASWSDYDQRKRNLIDNALTDADDTVSESVREAILNIEHTSLGRRFRDFSLQHINPEFYREEATGSINPISRFDLEKALKNSYQARSQYIHNLRKLPDLLTTHNSHSETCRIGNETWLTIQGLSRLARHVIKNFIISQNTVDSEEYDYSLEREGVIQVPLAPQYWVGKAVIYEGSGSRKLEGFLSQYADRLENKPNAAFTNLTDLLSEVESKIHELKKHDKLSYTALYLLFNGAIPETQKMLNIDKFSSIHEKELTRATPEALLLNLLFNIESPWDTTAHYDCLKKYFRNRDNKFNFRAPKIIEAGMALQLAERYRIDKDYHKAMELIAIAVENYPDHKALREFEEDFKINESRIDWSKVLLPKNEAGDK
ncbi:hypothetical protein [Vreelandella alkaliphila]|uniref:hypothetical protein n=1 Tax=Vreelandella alkaliphila TaxID=272774 RepID=UPI003FD8414D